MKNKKNFIALLMGTAEKLVLVLETWNYLNYVTLFPGSHLSSMEGK